MKKNIIQISFAFLALSIALGCENHEDFLSPQHQIISIEFDSTQVVIHENGEPQVIQLSFSKPVMHDGLLTLTMSNAVQSRFIIEPALTNGEITLNVLKNQLSSAISIKPINNSLADGHLEFDFTISSTSSDFVIGEGKTVSVRFIDDDSPAPIEKSVANFVDADEKCSESDNSGKSISIQLSEALKTGGSIELSLESAKAVYGTHFTTLPAAANGRVILNPSIGEYMTSFTVVPVNNSIISGEFEITFTIAGTTGSIVKGTQISNTIVIADDELTNKPKGYKVLAGQWGLNKIYEYDEIGRVKFAHIEKSTPAPSARTETYYYDVAGRIQKINTYPQIDNVFIWSGDRIVKSETIDHGVVTEYIEYDYDDRGNVSGTADYFRQQDGQFKLGFINIYLYFFDGNLNKSQTYIVTEESEEYTLISTRTYEGYLQKENPFPMVDILPTEKTQYNLPSTYTIEENGVTLTYTFHYEFREDGLVSKRIADSGTLSETSLYLYY